MAANVLDRFEFRSVRANEAEEIDQIGNIQKVRKTIPENI